MIERYQDGDLVVTYDNLEEQITIQIVSGGELERLSIDWTLISYGPEIYKRLSELFARLADTIEEQTEYESFLEDIGGEDE